MKFWDASAIVPLLVEEAMTRVVQKLAADDPIMLVWWAAEVELGASAVNEAYDRLKRLAGTWHEVDPNDGVREAAVRFLRVHPLRAADALQLAAARKEGFPVIDER
jgi:uncharacterized protein